MQIAEDLLLFLQQLSVALINAAALLLIIGTVVGLLLLVEMALDIRRSDRRKRDR